MTRRPGSRVRRRLPLLLPATLATLSLTPHTAAASTWANPAGGSWSDAANWSPATVPGYYPGYSGTDSEAFFNLGASAPDFPSYPGYTVSLPSGLHASATLQTDKVTFAQPAASQSRFTFLNIAANSGQSASLTLSGGTFVSDVLPFLATTGTGSLTLSPNTTFDTGSAHLTASGSGGTASLAASGPNSFILAGELDLANGPGTASLSLSSGAVAASHTVYVDYRFIGDGTVNLGGNGGTAHLTATGPGTTFAFYTCNLNNGTASFSDGAQAYIGNLTLGTGTDNASLSLDGPATALTALNSNFTVGSGSHTANGTTARATGSLSLSNAATLSAEHTDIDLGANGGVGSLSLASGSSASFHTLNVGYSGTKSSGTLTLCSGSALTTANAYVGPAGGNPNSSSPTGTVTLGSDDSSSPSTWTVSSFFSIRKGSVTLNPGGQLLAPALFLYPLGTLALAGGSASASDTLHLNGGTLTGAGTLHAPLIDASTYAPTISPTGTLALDADLSLASSSTTLAFDLSSPTTYDRLTSLHTLSFGGTLSVSLDPSYVPSPGDAFDLLDFQSATPGTTFSTLSLPSLPTPLTWNTSALYTTGTLTVLPEPTSLAACGFALLPLLHRRRRRRPWANSPIPTLHFRGTP